MIRPQDISWRRVSSADNLSAPTLRRLYDYWQGLPKLGIAPTRQSIRPRDLTFMLGWISIARVIDQGADYRFSLIGSEFANAINSDMTGYHMSELLHSAFMERTRAIFDTVIRYRTPVQNGPTPLQINKRDHKQIESLSLPLTRSGDDVDAILIGIALA